LRGELVPPQLPVLGKYDSRQEDVVTQHIAWSTAAGINVWDMEWVMPNDFLDTTIQNTILTNPHIGDIRFAMFYDYALRFHSDNNLTPDKVAIILSDFQYLASHYFSHPSYLKIGQRPVVFFFSAVALNPIPAVQQMVSSLRKAMSDAGFNVYLIGDEYYALVPPNPARIANWDAIFGYDVYVGYAGYSDDNGYLAFHSMTYKQYQAVAQQLGVDFVPSLTPGDNDRAVRRTCANNPALARRTSATAPEGSMFTSFLRDLALPYANNSQLKMIHISTFEPRLRRLNLDFLVLHVRQGSSSSEALRTATRGFRAGVSQICRIYEFENTRVNPALTTQAIFGHVYCLTRRLFS
jgi:hypothetical protein